MNSILITGGLGYVGGRVADYLKRNRPEFSIRLTSRGNQRLPLWAKDFEVVTMDLLDPGSIARSLSNVDTVIHLAGLNEVDSFANPIVAIDANTKGTYHLMECAARAGVRRVSYVSTFHVYGWRVNDVITECTVPDPFHPYAITRLAAEHWVRHGVAPSLVDTVVFRLSNGYGYPMDRATSGWTLVFNDLCRQAVTNRRIVLKTSGRQCRDFIPLRDVARAIDHFVAMPPGRWRHEVYNLGGECTMSILEVAKRVASVYERLHSGAQVLVSASGDSASVVEHRPFRYSTDKIRSVGFRLDGDMDQEIEQTMRMCIEKTGDGAA